MTGSGELDIRVSAADMRKAEQEVVAKINDMEPVKRALLWRDDSGLWEDFGWAWTPDYTLVKAAPGLTE